MNDAPELMRLADAARSMGLKTSSLKTEIRRGRLTPVQIAGRLYVTREALNRMIAACHVKPKDRDCGSNATETDGNGGSSLTVDPSVALAAAKESLKGLSEPLRPTSPRNTSRAARAPA